MSSVIGQTIIIGVSGGHGFAALKQTFGESGKVVTNNYSSDVSKLKSAKTSFGEGTNFRFDLIRNSGKNYDLGVSLNYHIGQPFVFSKTTESNYYYSGHHSNSIIKEVTRYNEISQVQFIPFLKLSTQSEINLYMKLGGVFGCWGRAKKNYEQSTTNTYDVVFPSPHDTTYSQVTNLVTLYKGGISAGFMGALGLEVQILNNLFFTAEGSFVGMQWAPNKSKQSYEADFHSIDNERKIYWSYSSINIQVGVSYKFNKKEKLIKKE